MKKNANFKFVLFPVIIWLSLFVLLQLFFRYNYYVVEGTNLFLFDRYYLLEELKQPGGFAILASKFLIQFYAYPLLGAVIIATLLTAVCVQLMVILKQMVPNHFYPLLYVLPVILLLFCHFDLNFYLHGIVAIVLMLATFQMYLKQKKLYLRMVYSLLAVPLLFGIVCSVSLLFAVSVLTWECLKRSPKAFWFIIPLVEAVIIAFGSVFFSIVGDFRFAFLPDMYYQFLIASPPYMLYYTWISIPVVCCIAWLMRKRKDINTTRQWVEICIQATIMVVICWVGILRYSELRSMKFREIDYYARNSDWDKVISRCQGPLENYLYLINLNMALANKGLLADNMFGFDQKGPAGLSLEWNGQYSVTALLSDYYFTVGNMAGALRTAFEGNIVSGNESVRMIKRMIQVYLVYGNYPIAERHLNVLEKTLCYRQWARAHRRFLYNDKAIDSDPLLGTKRRTMVDKNYLYTIENPDFILAETARYNPSNKTAIEYLGAIHLLSKDLWAFEAFLKEFYGSNTLPVLPRSFQEAVVILYEPEPEKWQYYQINDNVIARFNQFKQDYMMLRNNPAHRATVERNYKDTYWYYLMIK